MVEVLGKPPRYGVIRWIGTLDGHNNKIIAGLEMVSGIWRRLGRGRACGGWGSGVCVWGGSLDVCVLFVYIYIWLGGGGGVL